MNLNEMFYDCKVVDDTIDYHRKGGVRAMILGITDAWEIASQPVMYPMPGFCKMQSVPQKGQILAVHFFDGDMNAGFYFSVSQDAGALPQEFISQYPYMAVSNLGALDYMRYHNRQEKETDTVHPSNTHQLWDGHGTFHHLSNNGYTQMGMNAKDGGGTRDHAVLTEATINPATGRPFGHALTQGGTRQGSEYFIVTHMSNESAGFGSEPNRDPPRVPDVDILEPTPVREIPNEGETVYVEFQAVGNAIAEGNKQYKNFVLEYTSAGNFAEVLRLIATGDTPSAHYVIGRADTPSNDPADGFYQIAELAEKPSGCPGNSVKAIVLAPHTDWQTPFQTETVEAIRQYVKTLNGGMNPAVKRTGGLFKEVSNILKDELAAMTPSIKLSVTDADSAAADLLDKVFGG